MSAGNRPSVAARWFLSLTGLSLMAIGGLFIVLMMRSSLRAADMRHWPEIECVILESVVEERVHDPYSPPEYRPRIDYGYEWRDQPYTSDRYSLRGTKWSSDKSKAEELISRLPTGSRQTCRVNPDSPSQAVLKADSLAPLYSIWFPGLFVVGGVGIVVRAWRSGNRSRADRS